MENRCSHFVSTVQEHPTILHNQHEPFKALHNLNSPPATERILHTNTKHNSPLCISRASAMFCVPNAGPQAKACALRQPQQKAIILCMATAVALVVAVGPGFGVPTPSTLSQATPTVRRHGMLSVGRAAAKHRSGAGACGARRRRVFPEGTLIGRCQSATRMCTMMHGTH